jgi:glucokinase
MTVEPRSPSGERIAERANERANERSGERATERVVVIPPSPGRGWATETAEPAAPDTTVADRPPPEGYLAIDIGASRLAAGIVDADGEVLVRDRVATPARNVWPALTQLVGRVLAANPSAAEPCACGVTCPGPIDRGTGAMKPVGMPTWHDFPIRRELTEMTDLPVELDTPGRGLALGELWRGTLAELPPARQHFATLVLGDDVDGAFVTNGKIVQGTTDNLGQFGHLIVEPGGVECVCGSAGCLSAYAGARGIEAGTGRDLRRTPPAIVERTGIMAGRACASLAAMLDVSEIVLGGAVPSVFGEPFFEALAREFEHRSGLAHLATMQIRGVATGRIGPLVAAAAVARHRVPAATRVSPDVA